MENIDIIHNPEPIVLVTFPPDVHEFCVDFAERCWESNKDRYMELNPNRNPETLKAMNAMGKFGEFAVYHYLTESGYECTVPDTTIYEVKDKSFDPDISSNGEKIHVKTTPYKEYRTPTTGPHWSFAWQNSRDVDVFDNQIGIAAFCEMVDTTHVIIKAMPSVKWLHEHDLFVVPYKTPKTTLDKKLSNTRRWVRWTGMQQVRQFHWDAFLPPPFDYP